MIAWNRDVRKDVNGSMEVLFFSLKKKCLKDSVVNAITNLFIKHRHHFSSKQ